MSPPDPITPRCLWCGENHPTKTIRAGEIEVTTCPRLGAHEAVMLARPDLVAAVRLADGAQVVALEPKDLEVKAFGAEDLDERWVPWRQEYMCKLPEKP